MAWMAMIPGWLPGRATPDAIALLAYLQVAVEDKLPSTDEMADELGIDAARVEAAWDELMRLGLIVEVDGPRGHGYRLGSFDAPILDDDDEEGDE